MDRRRGLGQHVGEGSGLRRHRAGVDHGDPVVLDHGGAVDRSESDRGLYCGENAVGHSHELHEPKVSPADCGFITGPRAPMKRG